MFNESVQVENYSVSQSWISREIFAMPFSTHDHKGPLFTNEFCCCRCVCKYGIVVTRNLKADFHLLLTSDVPILRLLWSSNESS